VLGGILGRDRHDRNIHIAADHLGNGARLHTLLAHSVHRRPAVGTATDVTGDALGSRDADERRDKAVVPVPVHRRRESQGHRAHAAIGAFKSDAERLGSGALRAAGASEVGEVVLERKMDDAVGILRARAQALEVVEAAEALRRRGVQTRWPAWLPRPVSRSFRVAFERWIGDGASGDLGRCIREALDQLKVLTAET